MTDTLNVRIFIHPHYIVTGMVDRLKRGGVAVKGFHEDRARRAEGISGWVDGKIFTKRLRGIQAMTGVLEVSICT